jgi:hypothetical protein
MRRNAAQCFLFVLLHCTRQRQRCLTRFQERWFIDLNVIHSYIYFKKKEKQRAHELSLKSRSIPFNPYFNPAFRFALRSDRLAGAETAL